MTPEDSAREAMPCLPVIDQASLPGASLVRRAIGVWFVFFATVITLAGIVAATVSVDVAIDANGTLEPRTVTAVRSLEAGAVTEVLVRLGDTVAKGQVLIRLDSMSVAAELDRLRAQEAIVASDMGKSMAAGPIQARRQEAVFDQAQARVMSARATLRERLSEYRGTSNIDSVVANYVPGLHIVTDRAVADLRDAEASLRVAREEQASAALGSFDVRRGKADLSRIRADARLLTERLQRLEVRAPADGVVLTEHPEELVGTVAQAGARLLEIADPSRWQAHLFLGEEAIHDVHIDDSVRLEIPALRRLEAQPLTGWVVLKAEEPFDPADDVELGQGGDPRALVGSYRVVVALDSAEAVRIGDGRLRRGFQVSGKLVSRRARIVSLFLEYVRGRGK